jgi:hypothetical protein
MEGRAMSDDLVKRLYIAVNQFYGTHPCGLLKESADRIEELEAALRRISHAPHGKVFNAHGHEEAYLIACKALWENENGFAANANKEMFK